MTAVFDSATKRDSGPDFEIIEPGPEAQTVRVKFGLFGRVRNRHKKNSSFRILDRKSLWLGNFTLGILPGFFYFNKSDNIEGC